MELRHLQSFIAVAESLSFVRASRNLHISQSALTAQIQKLEQDLNVQLFIRNRRSVELTAAGKVFVLEAVETLARAARAMQRVRKAAAGEAGQVRVGFVSSAALDMIPPLAVAFRKSHPEVDLDLIDLQTSVQLEGLCSNSLDVGFLRMPADHHLLALTVVHREHFVMVLPKTHVLAKKSRVNLGDLRKDKFVAYGRRWAPGFFDSIMGMCHKVGFSPDIVQETAEMFTASALVGAELGVAIMPRSVVLAQTAGVVFKLIPKSVGVSEIAVATAKGNASPLVRSFVRFTSRFQKLAL